MLCPAPPRAQLSAVPARLPCRRAAPEAIVRAQLAALQQGDVFGASCFSMHARSGRGLTSRRTGARCQGRKRRERCCLCTCVCRCP